MSRTIKLCRYCPGKRHANQVKVRVEGPEDLVTELIQNDKNVGWPYRCSCGEVLIERAWCIDGGKAVLVRIRDRRFLKAGDEVPTDAPPRVDVDLLLGQKWDPEELLGGLFDQGEEPDQVGSKNPGTGAGGPGATPAR